jgi:hypothetical protein
MTRAGLLPGFLLVLLGGTALVFSGLDPSPGPTADHVATAPPAYTSHYLVFGTRDASGTPRMLAVDFNRTERGDGQVAYEYKLFVGRGADWSMPVYETWTTSPDAEIPRFPARGSLDPTLTNDGDQPRQGQVRIHRAIQDLGLIVRNECHDGHCETTY